MSAGRRRRVGHGAHQALAADVPPPVTVGSWSAPFVDTAAGALIPAAVAVLPDGCVLYGDGASGARVLTISGSGGTFAPAAGGVEGDVVQLEDGRQLVVGGGDSLAPPMAVRSADAPVPLPGPDAPAVRGARCPGRPGGHQRPGRGADLRPRGGRGPRGRLGSGRRAPLRPRAPDGVTLADGKVAVFSRTAAPVGAGPVTLPVRSVDVFDPASGSWSEAAPGLPAGKSLPPNARVFLAPDGSLFYTGDGQMFAPFGQSPDEALWVNQARSTSPPASGARRGSPSRAARPRPSRC